MGAGPGTISACKFALSLSSEASRSCRAGLYLPFSIAETSAAILRSIVSRRAAADFPACSRSAAILFVLLVEGVYELAHEIRRHQAILQAAEDARF